MTALDSFLFIVFCCSYARTPRTTRGVAWPGNTQCCLSFLCAAQQAAAAQAINIKQRADSNLISIKCRATAARKAEGGRRGRRAGDKALPDGGRTKDTGYTNVRLCGYATVKPRCKHSPARRQSECDFYCRRHVARRESKQIAKVNKTKGGHGNRQQTDSGERTRDGGGRSRGRCRLVRSKAATKDIMNTLNF